jgi:hypothetical protein
MKCTRCNKTSEATLIHQHHPLIDVLENGQHKSVGSQVIPLCYLCHHFVHSKNNINLEYLQIRYNYRIEYLLMQTGDFGDIYRRMNILWDSFKKKNYFSLSSNNEIEHIKQTKEKTFNWLSEVSNNCVEILESALLNELTNFYLTDNYKQGESDYIHDLMKKRSQNAILTYTKVCEDAQRYKSV